MSEAPSEARIEQEIEALVKMKPTVLRRSGFGDDHHAAIEAQIEVLRERMDQDDVDDNYADAEDNVRSSVQDAFAWLQGEHESEALTDDWESLVRE